MAKRTRSYYAIFAVLAAINYLMPLMGMGTSPALARPQSQKLSPTPEPPAIFDPQPGPFVVYLNNQGKLDEGYLRIIENAVRSWSRDKNVEEKYRINLDAFVICYRFTQDLSDWKQAYAAVEEVASRLKYFGAKAVVMPSGGACLYDKVNANNRPHVEIYGMINR